jgi:hypothetical protein
MHKHITRALVLCTLLFGQIAAFAEEVPTSSARRVHHVVIVWLKDAGSAAAREQYIAHSRRLSKLPMVLDYKVGTALPKTREIVDSSYDIAVVSTFADQEAIKAYLDHPEHQTIVQEALKPLVAKAIVYDFVDAP